MADSKYIVAVRLATSSDAVSIGERMREADAEEVWLTDEKRPVEACSASYEASTVAWTGTVDAQPMCIFGVAPLAMMGEKAMPWLLAAEGIEVHSRAFLRRNRHYIELMLGLYPVLWNMVYEKNELSLVWLQWLGFTIYPPVPFGPFDAMFHPFEMKRGDQNV